MANEQCKWDLLKDGFLWKEAASAIDDPEFQKRCENMVRLLQENVDHTDGLQLLPLDCAVAAFIRKQCVLRYESANIRITAFHAKEKVESADSSIRDSARIAAAFPSDDVLDRVIRHESLCDRQIEKYMELLDRLSKPPAEKAADIQRKPPRGESGEAKEGGQGLATGSDKYPWQE